MSQHRYVRYALVGAWRLNLLVSLLMLSACGQVRAPSFMIMGSYFPAWLIGLGVSIVLTVIVRAGLIRIGLDDTLPARLLVYACLCLLMTLAFTYFFFPR